MSRYDALIARAQDTAGNHEMVGEVEYAEQLRELAAALAEAQRGYPGTLEELAIAQHPDWTWDACCVCGSTDLNIRGVAMIHSDGTVSRAAWCSKMRCENDRVHTHHVTIPSGQIVKGKSL